MRLPLRVGRGIGRLAARVRSNISSAEKPTVRLRPHCGHSSGPASSNDGDSFLVGSIPFGGLRRGGSDRRRLLLAVDWMPMNMLVSQDATEIDTFISECELIGMEAYLQRDISSS